MALSAAGHLDVQVAGNDLNSGLYCTGGNTWALTDLTCTLSSGLSATPTVKSATYTFVSGDVGDYLYIGAGTDWLTGWYKILSVAAGVATVAAAANSPLNNFLGQGVALVATPVGGSFAIDRSQRGATPWLVIDNGAVTTSIAANVITLTGTAVNGTEVGNTLQFSAGTNVTKTTLYQVTAASIGASGAGTLTVTGAVNLPTGGTTTDAVGKFGGSFATPGGAALFHLAAHEIHVKANNTSADYTAASASTNIATGCVALTAGGAAATYTKITGYQSSHWDYGAPPTFKAGAINTLTLIAGSASGDCVARNIICDANNTATSTGFANLNNGLKLQALNCTVAGFSNSNVAACPNYESCYASACAIGFTNTTSSSCSHYSDCIASACTTEGFNLAGNGGSLIDCMAINGAIGFLIGGKANHLEGCEAYGNTSDGFRFTATTTFGSMARNCKAIVNGGWGFTATAALDGVMLFNCATYGNTSGGINTVSSGFVPTNVFGPIVLTGNPDTNPSGLDFSLNTTAGAGAALRRAGFPVSLPGLSTVTFLDIGPAQAS